MEDTRTLAPRAGRAKLRRAAALVAALLLGTSGWALARSSSRSLGPLAGHLLPAPVSFAGRVDERLEAGSYAYLRVARDGASDAWVVAVRPRARVGDRVRVNAVGRAQRFESKRLARRFDELWFAAVRTGD